MNPFYYQRKKTDIKEWLLSKPFHNSESAAQMKGKVIAIKFK
jgi:hypothetical protein